MTTTGRRHARRSQRRSSTCSVPASGRNPVSTPAEHDDRGAAAALACQRIGLDPAAADRNRLGGHPAMLPDSPAPIPRYHRSMAEISREDVLHVADLARLHLSDEEVDRMQAQLSNILEAIETLRDVDTSHVGPTASVIQLENVMREDDRAPRALARGGARERAPSRRPVPARPDGAGGGPMSDASPRRSHDHRGRRGPSQRRDELARADRCLPRAHRSPRRASEHVPRDRGRCGPTCG